MLLENSFTVPLAPEAAFDLLLKVPELVPCFPGAELTEVLTDRKFKGLVSVKVGPLNLRFRGEAEFLDIDPERLRARVKGRGSDQKGRGNADSQVEFRLSPAEGGTRVDISTEVNMSGALAQYGRSSGLMKEIAGVLTADFARNLSARIEGNMPAEGGANSISAFRVLGAATKSVATSWLRRKELDESEERKSGGST